MAMMTQITMAREDITDRHVQSAFSYIVSCFSVVGGAVYLSLYLPVFWRYVALAVAIPLLIWAVRTWVEKENKPPRRVLMMLSSHETGYDADEARAAADTFEDWNIHPVWCSLQGGAAPSMGGMLGVEGDDATVPLARCPAADFVALYLVGGPGAAFDWPKSAPLHARVTEILQQGGTVGSQLQWSTGMPRLPPALVVRTTGRAALTTRYSSALRLVWRFSCAPAGTALSLAGVWRAARSHREGRGRHNVAKACMFGMWRVLFDGRVRAGYSNGLRRRKSA